MKNRIARLTVFGLAACLLLTLPGCASILERSYSSSTPHVDRPATAGDSSAIRVENYRELVSAVLFLVSQGEEEGVIQLQDYAGEVEADLTAACLEVATEDPLGAYAVEYIKHETTRVVSYDQATLTIHYRRTPEQIRSISTVTGTGAIRTELQSALEEFETEVVFRVAYFAEDADFIGGLIRQAYYDTPGAALGMPEAQISLYPDSGSRRVVEILLTYPDPMEELDRKREAVDTALAAFRHQGTRRGRRLPAGPQPSFAPVVSTPPREAPPPTPLWWRGRLMMRGWRWPILWCAGICRGSPVNWWRGPGKGNPGFGMGSTPPTGKAFMWT